MVVDKYTKAVLTLIAISLSDTALGRTQEIFLIVIIGLLTIWGTYTFGVWIVTEGYE